MQKLAFGWCVALAVSTGAAVQYSWAVCSFTYSPTMTCSDVMTVSCPPEGICQQPNHCGLIGWHKSMDFGKEYKTCVSAPPTSSCTTSINGCRFMDYNFGCTASTGLEQKPCCYAECGTAL